MKHILSFSGPAIGLTKPYLYQVMHLQAVGRVQLWYQQPGHKWEIGHGKDIPAGSTPLEVAETMQAFILGTLSHESYNAVLPR